jgi:hypothetical protein
VAARNNGSLPSQVIIGAATLAVMFIGISGTLLWTISTTQQQSVKDLAQAQINSLVQQIQRNDKDSADRDKRQAEELARREAEIKATIHQIQDELDRRRNVFVTKDVWEREIVARNDKWHAQEEINRQAIDAYLRSKSFDAWKAEFDLNRASSQKAAEAHLNRILQDLDNLRNRIILLEKKQ